MDVRCRRYLSAALFGFALSVASVLSHAGDAPAVDHAVPVDAAPIDRVAFGDISKSVRVESGARRWAATKS